jgi:hypothetical protein
MVGSLLVQKPLQGFVDVSENFYDVPLVDIDGFEKMEIRCVLTIV